MKLAYAYEGNNINRLGWEITNEIRIHGSKVGRFFGKRDEI